MVERRSIVEARRTRSPAVRSTVRCNAHLGCLSRQWELKSSGNYTGYGQVFVKLFPSECIPAYLYLNFFKLIFRGLAENLKAISRETHYPSIS